MKVVIVIPTYNEKENIEATLAGLEAEIAKVAKHQVAILVFDSNSPDGTAELAKKLAKKYPNVQVQQEKEKSGLGGAYIQGMKYAMEKMKADVVFEYDADGSHLPKYIPPMMEELEKGADVVVGSRYIPGGRMPNDWGFNRKLVSYLGNFIARVVLFTPQYHDMTSGFRGTKTKYLKQVDLDNLLSKQFAYKLHVYYALHKLGAKIVEYPIEFVDRSKGKSKFPRNNIRDSLRVVFTLRLRESQQFIKFGIVGFIGFLVNAVGIEVLRSLPAIEHLAATFSQHQGVAVLGLLAAPASWSGAGGAELAIISNFTLNNLWTFKEKKITNPWKLLLKFLQFNFTSIGAVIIQFAAVGGATLAFGDTRMVRQVAFFLALVLLIVPYNYLMYTRIIWQTHKK
jgi:dolichol-phosphate mannosyltransferase